MFVGNGNAFGNMLMQSKGECPNCKASLTFGESAKLARSHGISDNVVMCHQCNHVYEITMVPGRMTLTKDVTARYPQIKPKTAGGGGFFSKLFKKGE